MKNLYLFILSFLFIWDSSAQITTPVIKANFGVEADLSSNFYNNFNQPGNDDWYSNGLPGSGNFVIDTTGAAALVASYADPANRMKSYSRFMRVAPYTTVNNRIWLDAVFHRDFHGTDSTVFAAGSNKNGMSPAIWTAPVAQNIPDKNDILDAFTHIRRAGPNLTDSLWMFGGISIENTTGNRYFDFELYQTDIRFNRATLSFLGFGPDFGHTTWKFDSNGNILKPGDIIFSAEYSSSSLSMLEARIWVHKDDLLLTPTAFTWGGQFDGASNGATYGYASIVPKTAGAFYTGLQSGNGVWAGPFGLIKQDNTFHTTYVARQFMEFSVNLSKLGLDPGGYGIDPCGSPFRRVLIKSRSSTAFTAELKDFIAPFSLFNYPPVEANSYLLYYCGTMPNTTINVTNPNNDLIYTWHTYNGNIVGSTIGTSIVVNMPGTYYVSQQLDLLCPTHSMDSVTILFDSVCVVLDVPILKFAGSLQNKITQVKWQVSNNELAAHFDLEYSTDNQNFYPLTRINGTGVQGIADYSYSHNVTGISAEAISYRLRITGNSGKTKLSNHLLFRLEADKSPHPVVFPNPIKGKGWVAIQSLNNSQVDIVVTDAYGRPLSNHKYDVNKGENVLELPGIDKLPSAIYLVKIKAGGKETTQKIIVKK